MSDNTSKPSLDVAFIGVGRMGAALMRCVLEAGHRVSVYDPSPQATQAFVASHAAQVRVASSPRDAADKAAVIALVVNTNEQLLEACLGDDGVLAGAKPGSAVLVHSTVAHDTLQRIAQVARDRGVHLLDAPVSGAMGQMSAGDLAVMVGGDEAAFALAKPVIETYGSLVLHLGPQGAGLDAKLAINLLRYLCMVASQEATRLAERAGVGAALAKLVAHSQSNRFTGDLAKSVPYSPEQRRKEAETSTKDLRAAIARGAELGETLASAERGVELMPRLWGADR